nr:AAA family ATPase [Candidatus Njordarchaeum guaymaensis]
MASLERGRIPSPRPVAVKEVPLVDRIEEMNVLKEAVYRAVHGEGGLVFVHGEAGIGKTRLIRELGAYSQSRGVQVLYGRCPALFRMDGVPPFILWKEVIKDYLETCTSEQLYRVIGYYPAEVAKLVPELGQKLRTISQSFPISPEQEQNRLFEAVSQFITNISQETPLLVILDDLQWTDPSSLLLLHYLARGAQKTSLLLLGAYRSTDIDDKHPLTPVLAELNRERLPQEIQLKRMSFSDVSEMIKNILEQEDVPEEFCKLVYDKTRGNPFFAEEVVKSLKEEGNIYLEEGRWKFKEISSIEFPKSVKNIIKARFSRLDDEYQNVLTFASFVGNDFTLKAMCALTGIEEDKLLEIMDRLIKTGFVKHTVIRGEDICSFADIIVRDIVYEEVGPFKRKKLHGVVGTALEKVYADKVDEHLGELALHFLESGDKEKAVDYFLKAGKRAQNVYAHNEAVSCLQHILELFEEKEGNLEQKASIMERLGDIKELMGETSACMECWDRSLTLWNQLGDKKNVARLHVKMAYTLWDEIGDKDKASEHHHLALE